MFRTALAAVFLLSAVPVFGEKPAGTEKIVFVLAGQSNMVGQGNTGELAPELKTTPPNVEYYLDGKRTDFAHQSTFGPEVAFSHELARAYPDKIIVIIKYATGGTSLMAWSPEWNAERAALTWNRFSGHLYERLMKIIREVNGQPGARYVAVVWMQGERDAQYREAGRQYAANLKALVHALRRDLKSPDLPFVLGLVNPPTAGYPGLDLVRKAQQEAEKALPNTALVATDGLTKHRDDLHYDTQGEIELGRRFAAAVLELRKKSGVKSEETAQSQTGQGTGQPRPSGI